MKIHVHKEQTLGKPFLLPKFTLFVLTITSMYDSPVWSLVEYIYQRLLPVCEFFQ